MYGAQKLALKGLGFVAGSNRFGVRLLPRSVTDGPSDMILSRLPDPLEADVSGRKMLLDVRRNQVARDIFLKGAWEPSESRLVESLLESDDLAIDLGANIGYYSLLIASKARQVYAFEPDPESFSLLSKNLELNHQANVVPVQKAASDRNGKLVFYRSANSARHGISPFLARGSEEVEAVRLDDFFPEGTKIDFIKMDIEAGEPFAVKGMERLIRDSPNLTMITEFWREGLEGVGVSPASYLGSLFRAGFSVEEISEAGSERGRAELREGDVERWATDHPYANLLCTKRRAN